MQSGKRSEKFASAKDFDKALAVAKSAKAIITKAKAPKRAGKNNAPTGTRVTAEPVEGSKPTIEQGINALISIFTERTDHTIKDIKSAERLAGILAQALTNTKAKAKKKALTLPREPKKSKRLLRALRRCPRDYDLTAYSRRYLERDRERKRN